MIACSIRHSLVCFKLVMIGSVRHTKFILAIDLGMGVLDSDELAECRKMASSLDCEVIMVPMNSNHPIDPNNPMTLPTAGMFTHGS